MTIEPQNAERLIKLLVYLGGVASTAAGALFASRIRVYEDSRKAHLEDLKQKVLIPLRDGLGEHFRPLVFGLEPLIFVEAAAPTEFRENANASNKERLSALEQKFGSRQFAAAVSAACVEATRATSEKKIQELAAVLVGSIAGSEWADPNEDVAVLIRDIAQLGERDLKVLGILGRTHATAIKAAPNLYEPDAFSRETAALMRDVSESGIHSDDFLSTCERLRGFGLAAEVLRNTAHMAPHDYCYRPTRRGLAVLDYLSAVPKSETAEATARP